MEDTLTIDLSPALMVGNTEVSSLTLREPTVGEVAKASREKDALATMILLVSLVSGQPRGLIETLPMRKFEECSTFLGSFLNSAPATGET